MKLTPDRTLRSQSRNNLVARIFLSFVVVLRLPTFFLFIGVHILSVLVSVMERWSLKQRNSSLVK